MDQLKLTYYSFTKLQLLLISLAIVLPFNFPAAFIILPLLSLFIVFLENRFRFSLNSLQISKDGYLLIILFGIHFLWFMLTAIETTSASDLEKSLPLLLFPLMISSTPIEREKSKVVVIAFIFSVIFSYSLSLAAAVHNYFYGVPRWGRPSDFFFHEQFTAGLFNIHPTYYSLLGCIGTFFALRELTKWKRIIIVLTITIFIILINARITILIQSLLILGFLLKEFRKGFKIKTFAVAAIVGVIIFGLLRFSGSVYDYPHRKMLLNLESSWDRSFDSDISDADGGLVIRFAIWRNAMHVIKENFLFGIGIGKEKQYLTNEFKKDNVPFLVENSLDAHSQLLSYLINMGFVGGIAVCIFFYLLIRTAIKARQWLYIELIIIFLIVGITESIFNRGLGVATFAFFNSFVFLKVVKNDA